VGVLICNPDGEFEESGESEESELEESSDEGFSSILHRAKEQPRFVPTLAESGGDGTRMESEAGDSVWNAVGVLICNPDGESEVSGESSDEGFSSILHRAKEQPRFVPTESGRDGTGAEREAGGSGHK
jgi:hypothetical protein